MYKLCTVFALAVTTISAATIGGVAKGISEFGGAMNGGGCWLKSVGRGVGGIGSVCSSSEE